MIEQIYQQTTYRPFRPFFIETSGGTLVRVSRPEWIFFPPESGHLIVYQGGSAAFIAFRDIRNVLVEQPPIPVKEELG
jgi:hypothetical protein